MQCDPNTISRLSSCLRCLTDGQLMQVRTFLICKWAQVAANAGGGPLIVLSTPGSISYQIVVDDLGDLGTVAALGTVRPLLVASTLGGIVYQIIVDDFGNLGTSSPMVGTGQTLTVTSTPGGIKYRIIVDDGGNLGTV